MIHNPMRILVLDDCREITDVTCLILNKSGYEARGVYTHVAAILAAREFQPDVFLTGFQNLCEENGCQTAAEVLTFLPECRVIIFSGTAAAGPVVEDYGRRGYDFEVLGKPVSPRDLLEKMGSYGQPPLPIPTAPPPLPAPERPHKFRAILKRLGLTAR
jgi:DNA-binding NtrC family response regulator